MKFCSFGFSKSSFCNVNGVRNSCDNKGNEEQDEVLLVWILKAFARSCELESCSLGFAESISCTRGPGIRKHARFASSGGNGRGLHVP